MSSRENRYWDSDLSIEVFEQIIDENVGLALKEYICGEDSFLCISWWDQPEPDVVFLADEGELEKRVSLLEMLKDEIDGERPGDLPDDDMFFDPKGDRRVILMQSLLRTYLDWKNEGVHIPAPEESRCLK